MTLLASPVWDNARREITQPWGPTTLTLEPWWPAKNCHWHCGVDIGLVTGTPLKAARAGQATLVSYGILVIAISAHEADCYVHIDRSVVTSGQWVTQGQLVAYSGAKIPSGGSLTGPHLHFEVQRGNLNIPETSLDPIPILTGGIMDPNLTALGAAFEAGPAAFTKGAWHDLVAGSWKKLNDKLDAILNKSVVAPVIDPQVAADLHTIAEGLRRLGIP